MKKNLPNRDVTYTVLDGCLVRTTTGGDGRAYTQRCSRAVYEAVAYAINETPAELCRIEIARPESAVASGN